MLKNGLIQGSFLFSQVLIRSFSVGWLMSALGQKQTLDAARILPSEWLVLGYTGHSPLTISSGWFRPEAAAELKSGWLSKKRLAIAGF
jgi:hypothetical protein